MIAIYVGDMGSGKTLSAIKEAYNYYLKGFKVLSNMHLNFPHEKITSNDIIKFHKNKASLYNCVVLIDEIHIFMDSRRAVGKKNVMGTYFITQTRKLKVKLLGTTQHRHQVDKRLRDNTQIFVDCESKELPLEFKKNEKLLIVINHVNTRKKYAKISFIGNKYYHLYDTEETIFDNDEEEEKPKRGKKKDV